MDIQKDIACCFTGHRPVKLPWALNEDDARCIALKEELRNKIKAIYERGYRQFLCGMAIGCDMYFAEAVLELQQEYKDIKLFAVIPCGSQPEKWTLAQRKRYNSIIDRCSELTVLQVEYSSTCMQKRNEYMVDCSSILLACYDGLPGGTMKTILYADRQGLETIIIDI